MQHYRAVRIPASIAALIAVAGTTLDLCAQEAAPAPELRALVASERTGTGVDPSDVGVPTITEPTTVSETADDPTIEFNLDAAPLTQVLQYFERETGLPIIYETDVPKATMTFKSHLRYTLPQALNIVNLNLNAHKVYLRLQDGYLYFETIEKAFTKVHQVYQGVLPESVFDSEIVTLTIPLQNTTAAQVAEQITPLIAEYGRVLAIDAQNFLVITETAGQVRRIQKIIAPIDSAKPVDAEYRVFKLTHTKPEILVEALTGLVGEKTVQTFIDAKGNKTVVEENTVPGVTMQPEPRLGAIICVGPVSRLDTIKELVDILDQPAAEGMGEVSTAEARTFQLSLTSAKDVARQLETLYKNIEKEERPSVVALPDVNKVMVSGSPTMIAKAETLIRAIEPDYAASPDAIASSSVRTVTLRFVDADAVVKTLNTLMLPAQKRLVRVSAIPGAATVVVSGPPNEAASVADLASALDAPEQGPAQIRQVDVPVGDVQELLQRAGELFEMSGHADRGTVQTLHVPGTRIVTLVGDRKSVDAFASSLTSAQKLLPPQRTTKLIDVRNTDPESLIVQLRELLDAARESESLQGREPPSLTFYAPTSTLVVHADVDQHKIVAEFVRKLDVIEQTDLPPIKLLTLRTANVSQIASLLNDQYAKRPQKDRLAEPVTIRADVPNNTLIVSAHESVLPEIKAFVDDLNREKTDGPERMTYTIQLAKARAADVAAAMNKLYPEPPMPRDRRGNPQPWAQKAREVIVSAEPNLNLLLIEAPAERIDSIRELAATLDNTDTTSDAELRIFPIESGDLDSIVQTLQQLATSGGLGPTGRTQVSILPQPRSSTIVISGPESIFERVEQVLADITSSTQLPQAELQTYSLKHARADRLGPTLQGLLRAQLQYHSIVRGVPDNEIAALLSITTEPVTNTLIVVAPKPIHEIAQSLLDVLDTDAASVGRSTMRVVPMQYADATQTADRMNELLSSGALDVSMPVRVFPVAGSNAILISGAPKDIERVNETLASLDVRPIDAAEARAQTFILSHARAEAIAPVLESILVQESVLDTLPMWDRGWYLRTMRNSGQEIDAKVRVTADARTNAIVVMGPAPMIDLAEQIIHDLDVSSAAQGTASSRPVRVLPLKNADAKEFAASIEAVFAEDMGEGQPPTLRVDTASNSLIIRATIAQMRTIEDLAAELDSASIGSGREMRTIAVDPSKANAQDIASTIRKVLNQRSGATVEVISLDDLLRDDDKETDPSSLRDGSSVFDIDTLGPDWLFVLRAQALSMVGVVQSPTKNASIGTFVSYQPEAQPATQPEVPSEVRPWFPAATVDPADAEPVVETAQPRIEVPAAQPEKPVASTPDVSDPDAADPDVTIAVDPATNSLVVLGPPRMAERIANIVEQLQQQMPSEPTRVRVITLPQTADARALARVVNETVRNFGQRSATNPSGFTSRVAITPDPTGGSLIVWANDTDFQVVGKLIASVAKLEVAGEMSVKVYPLTNITARNAQRAITDMLSAKPTGSQSRNVRSMAIKLLGTDNDPIAEGTLDPSTVRVSADASGTSIIVSAPADAIVLIDELVSQMDTSSVRERLQIRRYALDHAKAESLAQSFQRLFERQRQGPGAKDLPRAQFVADGRTNAMLVTASAEQHADVQELLATADAAIEDDDSLLEIIPIQNTNAQAAAKVVRDVFVGRDVGKEDKVLITGDNDSGILVVRANEEDMAEIKKIVAQVDSVSGGLPVRTVKLEQADAQATAQALTNFFRDRAQASGQRTNKPAAAIFGDTRSGTLIIAASDDDYEAIGSMIETLDQAQESQKLQINIIPIKHVKASDMKSSLMAIYDRLFDMRYWGNRRNNNGRTIDDEMIIVEVNEAANSVILIGQGETMTMMEEVIASLDLEGDRATQKIVRVIKAEGVDLDAIANIVRQAMIEPDTRAWWLPSVSSIQVMADRQRSSLLLVGEKIDVEEAERIVATLVENSSADQSYEAITLKHAAADNAARSLTRFFRDRARAMGLSQTDVSVIGSREGNVLIVSADEANMALVRDLLAHIDQPDMGTDRRVEIYTIRNADLTEMSETVRSVFPNGNRPDDRVLVIPQPSRNLLIVSAPPEKQAEIAALITTLDTFDRDESSRFVSVSLKNISAAQAATALQSTVGESMQIRITPINDNNTLAIAGSDEAVTAILEQIATLDVEFTPKPREFRKIVLRHAKAFDVYLVINKMANSAKRPPDTPAASIEYSSSENWIHITATASEMEGLLTVVDSLDEPKNVDRRTDWLKLEYANAKQAADVLKVFYGRYAQEAKSVADRDVSIRADEITNSLIISASEEQWKDIHALIERIDTKEYDTERQLGVIALKHADAQAVAQALNNGLQAPLQAKLEQERIRAEQEKQNRNGRNNTNDTGFNFPPQTIAINDDDVPSVSAERRTNTLIVFATPKQLRRIESIVTQLDKPTDPESGIARILTIASGKPSEIAVAITRVYVDTLPRGTRPIVFGDDASGVLIVRSDESEFARIKTLAESLQQSAGSRVGFHVIKLTHVPAAKVQRTVQRLFQPAAQRAGEALVVEVDRTNNALVVSTSASLVEQIRTVVQELDANPNAVEQSDPSSMLGTDITVVELTNVGPLQMMRMLFSLGLTQQQNQDQPGIVGEPVKIARLSSRSAIVITGAPADVRITAKLARSLDADSVTETQHAAIMSVRNNSAQNVVRTLRELIQSASDQSQPGIAIALAEQVRRRLIATEDGEQPLVGLDLSVPIQLIADENTNRVIIASSEENLISLRVLVESLDVLPVGDAVIVRIIPLSNAAPQQIQQIVQGLFQRGRALTNQRGTNRATQPMTVTGQALASEVAIEIDARTNAVIVAGSEEAVSFVEMMVERLDRDEMGGWVEPRILMLEHADARRIARTLNSALVNPSRQAANAMGLRQQFARIRVAQGDDHGIRLESDLYAPVSSLFISADETLNALVVVASSSNLKVVEELVATLDIPSASNANAVRFFPLEYAVADRVAQVVADVFSERERLGDVRPEDRVVIRPDTRTNSLMVWTSQSSLALVESLVSRLDTEHERLAVSTHVLAVPDFDVDDLAQQIESVMRATIDAATRNGQMQTAADVFSVQAEPSSDLLIITSSDDNLRAVEQLIEKMRTGKGPANAGSSYTPEIIHIASGFVDDVAANIDRLYVQPETERRGEGAVTVIPDQRLSALIVRGTEADVEAIRVLVASLDTPKTTPVRVMRRIELRYSNAREVANYVNDLLTNRGNGTRSAETLRLVVHDKDSNVQREIEVKLDDQVRSQIEITPEDRSNSVTVVAPEAVMGFIESIIEDQESSDNADRSVRHFVLKNASASAMARVLRDLFDLQEVGSNLILVPSPRTANNMESGEIPLQPAADERQKLSITVDQRTNSLLVSGTAEYLDKVDEVIQQLENIDVAQRYRLVYQLRNAQAEDIERALREYFGAEQQATLSTSTPDALGSLQSKLEYEVTIVGDIKSNTVLVAASPRQIDVVEEIIRELDTAPPQVRIEVLIAEVTLDDGESWGVDLTLRNLGGDDFTFQETAAGLGLTAAVGAGNLALASSDIDLMVRALEGRGKLRVLSRPQIAVTNNEQGVFKVVEEVSLLTGFETLDSGRTRALVERAEVGVSLNVTPTINADGFVRMDIQPEISALTDSRSQISEDFVSENFTKRELDTVVTIRNGQTAVIGGIIQSSEEERQTQVPFFGDLPVVGWVFRTNKVSNVRTELLMLLTPRIIPSESSSSVRIFNDITGEEINRMTDPMPIRRQLPGFGPGTEHDLQSILRAEPDGSTSLSYPTEPSFGRPAARSINPAKEAQ